MGHRGMPRQERSKLLANELAVADVELEDCLLPQGVRVRPEVGGRRLILSRPRRTSSKSNGTTDSARRDLFSGIGDPTEGSDLPFPPAARRASLGV